MKVKRLDLLVADLMSLSRETPDASTLRTRVRLSLVLTGLWLVFAAFNSAAFATPSPARPFWSSFWYEYTMCIAYWATWGPATVLVFLWSRKYPIGETGSRKSVTRLLVYGLLLAQFQTLVYIVASPFVQMFYCKCSYVDVIQAYPILRLFFGWRLLYGQLIFWAIVATEHAIRFYRKEKEQQLQAARLQALVATAKLESIASRIHPHFLFNSFHTIVSLIETRHPDQARDMAVGLCSLLQRALSDEATQMVQLKDEIEFVEDYLKLEQIRFEDRLTVTIQVEPDVRFAYVPRFFLQPLAENAIRHGVSQTTHPCTIFLSARRVNKNIEIIVRNDAPLASDTPANTAGLGIGLRITQERLALIYGDRHHFEFSYDRGAKAVATITVPYEDFVKEPVRETA